MKLSIITVNYNNLEGLKNTAASINAQTWRHFEWIIIDGGSTDGSAAYIQQLATAPEHNISFWCSEPDKGIYNAMNKGIGKARGEYLNFMNSGDTFYEAETLEKVAPYLEKGEADVLYGDALYVNGEDEEMANIAPKLSFRFLYHHTINHQATFCKTEWQKKYGYDESYRLLADRHLWLKMYLKGHSFRYTGGIVVRFDATGASGTSNDVWIKEMHRIHDEIIPPAIQRIRVFDLLYKVYLQISHAFKRP